MFIENKPLYILYVFICLIKNKNLKNVSFKIFCMYEYFSSMAKLLFVKLIPSYNVCLKL